MSAEVRLTWSEIVTAANIGVRRRVQNLGHGIAGKYKISDADAWRIDIEGALAEMAVAKLTGRYWSGELGNWKADDVGPLQVRSSTNLNARLILHPDDPDDRAFILVTGAAPVLTVVGWIMARDGKRLQFWADPSGKGRPAFFVPQTVLRDIRELGLDRAFREAAE